MAANLEMYLYRLKCINENDFGFGSDEPYVMVWVGEKPRLRPDIQQPISLITLYGIWEDVDGGEEVYTVEIPDLSNMPDLIMKLFLEMWYNSIKDMHQDRRRFWV